MIFQFPAKPTSRRFGSPGQNVPDRASSRRQEALFHVLARVEPNPDEFRPFFHQFAGLRTELYDFDVDKNGRLIVNVPSLAGHPQNGSDWRRQIRSLRKCVQLWDVISSGNTAELARRIKWRSGRSGLSIHYDSHPDLAPGTRPEEPDRREQVVIASAAESPRVLNSLTPGDVRGPALIHLSASINPQLINGTRTITLRVPGHESLSLLQVPLDLIGGIWLQFAQAVAENKSYQACKECGTWFEVSSHGARKSRVYCSDTCKVVAYRDRILKAIRLKAEGWSIPKIAKELGSTEERVEGWVSFDETDEPDTGTP